jgi:hypothetical protein
MRKVRSTFYRLNLWSILNYCFANDHAFARRGQVVLFRCAYVLIIELQLRLHAIKIVRVLFTFGFGLRYSMCANKQLLGGRLIVI